VPNVVCVGGSWVASDEMIRDGKWDVIESLARQASMLKPI
jgi:2-dehydro-3-deoxyphosphogluconate aldolase/(4S)-4-hydroxy-2-oxoglutarate aldolase